MEGNPVGLCPGVSAAFVGGRTRISVAVRRHGGPHSPLSRGPYSFSPPRFERESERHRPLPASPLPPAHRSDSAEIVGKNEAASALNAHERCTRHRWIRERAPSQATSLVFRSPVAHIVGTGNDATDLP